MGRTKDTANHNAREAARGLGQSTFQGSDCKHGHGGLRYVIQGACIECAKQYAVNFRIKHPEHEHYKYQTPEQKRRSNEYHKKYVAENKERVAAYQKEYHKTYKQK